MIFNLQELKKTIEISFKEINKIDKFNIDQHLKNVIVYLIKELDAGTLRVAKKINGKWITYSWIKKAILLLFYINENKLMKGSETNFFDKIKMKFSTWDHKDFQCAGFRIVPFANVRQGVFIGKNTVVMPSYINIGAYIDTGSMIDTWVTIGSCAQIGKNVHLSGGVGIGGVLEPIQDNPTIIEDNCFIGARSEIAEGVIIEENSVISMGVFIGKSTKIYDRITKKIHYGYVPACSVVVAGSLPSKDGKCNIYSAIIVKKVDSKTKSKVQINNLLHMDF